MSLSFRDGQRWTLPFPDETAYSWGGHTALLVDHPKELELIVEQFFSPVYGFS